VVKRLVRAQVGALSSVGEWDSTRNGAAEAAVCGGRRNPFRSSDGLWRTHARTHPRHGRVKIIERRVRPQPRYPAPGL